MNKTLHILNGDAIKPLFLQSGIEGDVVVWREAFIEGPIEGDIKEPAFWERRKNHLKATYPEHYSEDGLNDIMKLGNTEDFDEVVLWFEYDLFCHANMLGCLAYICHHNVSLVCLGDELTGQFQTLGEIGPSDYQKLYANRSKLNNEDITYAGEVWKAFQTKEVKDVQPFIQGHPTFKYLGKALAQMVLLEPNDAGLNQLQHEMHQLKTEGLEDRKVVGTMLRRHPWLGLGDSQYWQFYNNI